MSIQSEECMIVVATGKPSMDTSGDFVIRGGTSVLLQYAADPEPMAWHQAMTRPERVKLSTRLAIAAGEIVRNAGPKLSKTLLGYFERNRVRAWNDELAVGVLSAYINARGLREDFAVYVKESGDLIAPANLSNLLVYQSQDDGQK